MGCRFKSNYDRIESSVQSRSSTRPPTFKSNYDSKVAQIAEANLSGDGVRYVPADDLSNFLLGVLVISTFLIHELRPSSVFLNRLLCPSDRGNFFRCRYCAVDISHRYKVTQTYCGIHLCGQWICVVS